MNMSEHEKFNHFEAIKQFSENTSPIDFYLIFQNWPMFMEGAWVTITLVGLSLLLAGLISVN